MNYVIDWRKSLRYEAPSPWTRFITILVDNEVFKEAPFDVTVVEYPPGAKCPQHLHEEAVEIYYVLRGEIVTIMEGNSYRVRNNNLMYIPAKKIHQTQNSRNEPCIFIAIHSPPEVKELAKIKRGWKKTCS